ncbi:MAG: hypothetical protein JWM59_491 [Verrucomicrobiales bacterium]|nr:hypothetical protein [Verrucomicrobiales bacterium]
MAGVLAVRAFDIIPPTRIRIENTVSGGFDALPTLTKNLLHWEQALRFLVAGFAIAAVAAVWLTRGLVWILTLSLVCAVLLLLVPPAIRFILDQAFIFSGSLKYQQGMPP